MYTDLHIGAESYGNKDTAYDLIVVGGGFTGVAAALAAARRGQRVLLAEESNALGKKPTVHLFCPLWPTGQRIPTRRSSSC